MIMFDMKIFFSNVETNVNSVCSWFQSLTVSEFDRSEQIQLLLFQDFDLKRTETTAGHRTHKVLTNSSEESSSDEEPPTTQAPKREPVIKNSPDQGVPKQELVIEGSPAEGGPKKEPLFEGSHTEEAPKQKSGIEEFSPQGAPKEPLYKDSPAQGGPKLEEWLPGESSVDGFLFEVGYW